MPIPLLANFSCGVGVPPAPEFDEKECSSRGLLLNRLRSPRFFGLKEIKTLDSRAGNHRHSSLSAKPYG